MQSKKLHKLYIRPHSLYMVKILQIEDLLSTSKRFHSNNHVVGNMFYISNVNMHDKDQEIQRGILIAFQCHTSK